MHEARAGKMGDVIGEAKVLVKNYIYKLRTGEFGVNVWIDAESMLREIDGTGLLSSCSRRPISIIQFLRGLRQRRFARLYHEGQRR